MPAIATRLQQYIEAITDPTRGLLLVELDEVGEATPTQLAARLGLTANNVYHHMRVLRSLQVVDEPRVVPGVSYVEKYYRIHPELRAALRLDAGWYQEAQGEIEAEDRQLVTVSICLTMSLLLRRAARRYAEMTPAEFDRLNADQLLFLSLNRLSRDQLQHRLESLRELNASDSHLFAEDLTPRTDLMLIAGLPAIPVDDGRGRRRIW